MASVQAQHGIDFTTRDEVRGMLASARGRFYVYALGWPDGTPFYIGKGSNSPGVVPRVFQHEAEARTTARRSHKLNILRKLTREGLVPCYAISGFFDGEFEAHAVERGLILRIGRHDLRTGPLANQTDGGEGTSNPSQESRDRRLATLGGQSDDPDRRRINEFFAEIGGPQDSVPIKPLLGWRKAEPLVPSLKAIGPTSRMAKAVVASAAANGVLLRPGVMIPRLLQVDGVEYLIENGCGKEAITAGVLSAPPAVVLPRDESMALTERGFRFVVGTFGAERLVSLGVLEP
ncbi:GIY-YIG nuclease family protein [Roseomonas sp. E05]|uniref:GIY-YIG nuclease family protein n=1 Tax=Roseomonas sp. E05 TaxID=3046310 RepID=UPI0024B95C64|nr:GIY-YIG nuclease family protein [Roseomonas sp. E05]MDJ0390065.1 GIY-YIG nuclease family protein [Roseomonas sp. E05]